jgi:GNAT superfamily N-acetyltransferase
MSTHVFSDGFDPSGPASRANELLRMRQIGLDDWSAVRYVHAMAFRTFVAPRVTHQFTDDFMARLNAPMYVDQLSRSGLSGAWIDGELAGTVGWRPLDGRERIAVIEGLFVSPLFAFMGIGSALLAYAENQARHAGYDAFIATVPLAAASFLMRFGYEISAQVPSLGSVPDDVPVFVMRKRDADVLAASDEAAEDPQPQFGH